MTVFLQCMGRHEQGGGGLTSIQPPYVVIVNSECDRTPQPDLVVVRKMKFPFDPLCFAEIPFVNRSRFCILIYPNNINLIRVILGHVYVP